MPRTSKADDLPVYNRLAVLRADRGWSRKDLADAVDVHYQTIGYLERGEYKPSLVLALRIAALFDLPVEAVFSLKPLTPLSEQLYAAKSEPVR
ncbi:MAG: helix-turn-helix transcriptional regulator [Pseudomonadota bacterium]